MNMTQEETDSNVIEVSFTPERRKYSQGIEHPASLGFKEGLIDDPLEELLGEFEDGLESKNSDEYISEHFCLKNDCEYKLTLENSAVQMGDTLLKQTQKLKEDLQLLSYYLGEMNIKG